MTRTLYDHQRRALTKLPVGGGYLAFEQGLGKTLTAIEYVRMHGYKRILVVSPAVATMVWQDELEKEYIHVELQQGSRARKADRIAVLKRYEYAGYIVLNYEALLDRLVEKAIRQWGPDLIIVDEAHKIKNAVAKRSKVLHRLSKDTPCLLLSGTPITRNLLDLYSQYKTIDQQIWNGQTWTAFKQRYGVFGGYGGYELLGYRDTEDLKARIAPYTLVARKEDTLDLPDKTFTTVRVHGDDNHWRAYSAMARTGVWKDWITTTPLEVALRLAQIAASAKVPATVEFVRGLRDQGQAVVVYARFRSDLGELSEALGVEALHGGTNPAHRRNLVEDFTDGRTDIFLSQISAGSTGITLTAASHMVYHSLTFAYEDWAQSQDRIHRIGQTRPVNYYHMTMVGPKGGMLIDGLVLKSLETKDDVAGMITRDPRLLLPKELT